MPGGRTERNGEGCRRRPAGVRPLDRGRDGDYPQTTLGAATRELADSDVWAGQLETQLCREFVVRAPARRRSVRGVHRFVSDALGAKDEDEVRAVEWIESHVPALRSSDDAAVIRAALHLGHAVGRYWKLMRQVPMASPGLREALEQRRPACPATAWALAEFAKNAYSTGLRPTTPELHRLHAILGEPDIDAGVVESIISILAEGEFTVAIPTLRKLVAHSEPGVRPEPA